MDAALVLLADHELSASAMAARIAASAWADPYRVVLAGLGPLGGALHGAMSLAVADLLEELDSPDRAFAVLEHRLAIAPVPGFGHGVYRDRDPRAEHLLDSVSAVAIAATTMFTITRIAGLIAHALEE